MMMRIMLMIMIMITIIINNNNNNNDSNNNNELQEMKMQKDTEELLIIYRSFHSQANVRIGFTWLKTRVKASAAKKEWDGQRSRREGAEEKWGLKSIKVRMLYEQKENYKWNPLYGQFLRATVDAEEHGDELVRVR